MMCIPANDCGDFLYGELSNQVQRPLIENFIGSLKAKAFTWTHV